MDLILKLIDLVLNLDKYLGSIIQTYGTLTYALLFLVIFCETGLVITPFLPGDSLLFAVGAFAATGVLDIKLLFLLILGAAIIGDNVNYHLGKFIGSKIMAKEKTRLIKKEYLIKTEKFYERHGGKTLIICRFVPIVRTFAPFVAGISRMPYLRFLPYCLGGNLLWTSLFLLAGYFFGNLPFVKENFTIAIFAIILISLIPGAIEFYRQRQEAKRERGH